MYVQYRATGRFVEKRRTTNGTQGGFSRSARKPLEKTTYEELLHSNIPHYGVRFSIFHHYHEIGFGRYTKYASLVYN